MSTELLNRDYDCSNPACPHTWETAMAWAYPNGDGVLRTEAQQIYSRIWTALVEAKVPDEIWTVCPCGRYWLEQDEYEVRDVQEGEAHVRKLIDPDDYICVPSPDNERVAKHMDRLKWSIYIEGCILEVRAGSDVVDCDFCSNPAHYTLVPVAIADGTLGASTTATCGDCFDANRHLAQQGNTAIPETWLRKV
jgi:hypothetical protein